MTTTTISHRVSPSLLGPPARGGFGAWNQTALAREWQELVERERAAVERPRNHPCVHCGRMIRPESDRCRKCAADQDRAKRLAVIGARNAVIVSVILRELAGGVERPAAEIYGAVRAAGITVEQATVSKIASRVILRRKGKHGTVMLWRLKRKGSE